MRTFKAVRLEGRERKEGGDGEGWGGREGGGAKGATREGRMGRRESEQAEPRCLVGVPAEPGTPPRVLAVAGPRRVEKGVVSGAAEFKGFLHGKPERIVPLRRATCEKRTISAPFDLHPFRLPEARSGARGSRLAGGPAVREAEALHG